MNKQNGKEVEKAIIEEYKKWYNGLYLQNTN